MQFAKILQLIMSGGGVGAGHQPACKTAASFLNSELIEAVKLIDVREDETWGSVLRMRICQREQL